MKKIIALCLCAALCFPVAACGALGDAVGKSSQNEQTAVLLDARLDSGKFAVDGEVFSFPSAISDWTNNGWHISNNYGNKDKFELEPSYESTSFELFRDDTNHYVYMKAFNTLDESAKIEDCMVSYVGMYFSTVKDNMAVELPGGVTSKTTKDEVLEIYGEPYQSDGNKIRYAYEADGWECLVLLEFEGDNIESAEYYLSDSNWGSITSAEECEQFVDNALKASFYGDYQKYVENKFDTEEGAIELYESEIKYFAEGLMYYLDIDTELVDQEILDGFYDVSKSVLAKIKWDTPSVELDEPFTTGTLTLVLYPIDFLEIILDDANAANEAYAAKYANTDFSSLTDDDWIALENEYAGIMLDVVIPKVDEISYLDPVEKKYRIDIDDTILDDEWGEIDDILMGLTIE